LKLAVLLTVLMFAATPRASLPDIEDEVMCVECGTVLSVSNSPVAEQERAFIRQQIAEGKTKAQIKAELAEQYGPNVLGDPPDKGFNVAVWLVPAVLALAAAGAVWTTARRWRRASTKRDPEDELARGDGRELDPADRDRLERDMAGYDL
jgi:cytochrome c-type biogenesis protein CcmH/NrfF